MTAADIAPSHAKTLFLVSCVGQKRAVPCVARDLYVSDWFRKARTHIEAFGAPWAILSAEYGLVDPGQALVPYERTLNRMPLASRRAWALRVLDALIPRIANMEKVVLFAGERYREFLVPALEARGVRVEVPLAGLRIGEQLRWFKEHSPR